MIPHAWKRSLRFWWQRRTRGWDDSESWNLDAEIARFALPRLRRFRELPHGIWGPNQDEESASRDHVNHVLGEIEWFLTVHASDEGTWQIETEEERERYKRAARIFGENFGHLWS